MNVVHWLRFVGIRTHRVAHLQVLWLAIAVIGLMLPACAGGMSFDDYWNEANQKPHKTSESSNCTEIITDGAIYLFTKPNNPDHPALFIRRIVFLDGKMVMHTQAHSFRPDATEPTLRNWMENPFKAPPEDKPN
ncbi:MAG: hypothetical protein P4L57_09255 [Rhizomicrobium sp.]|nr:hypothetical protein [Rhizomicrobium sp.]